MDLTHVIDKLRDIAEVDALSISAPKDMVLLDPSVPLASVPAGRTLQSLKPFLDEYLARPVRAKGITRLKDVDSFIIWVNRCKQAASVIYADPDRQKASLTAVIDHNFSVPDWEQYRGHYALPFSDEWQAWMAAALRSDEARAKMSAARLGKKHSDETCAKISEAQLGKKLSDEVRAKMSAAKLGKKHRDETRAKMSAALKAFRARCAERSAAGQP
jgi:hypothetical protein